MSETRVVFVGGHIDAILQPYWCRCCKHLLGRFTAEPRLLCPFCESLGANTKFAYSRQDKEQDFAIVEKYSSGLNRVIAEGKISGFDALTFDKRLEYMRRKIKSRSLYYIQEMQAKDAWKANRGTVQGTQIPPRGNTVEHPSASVPSRVYGRRNGRI